MQQGLQLHTAFTLLHNRAAHQIPLSRRDNSTACVTIDDRQYAFPFDIRDQRTVLVFDGAIPPHGVSKRANVMLTESLREILPVKNCRLVTRPEEWPLPKNIRRLSDALIEL